MFYKIPDNLAAELDELGSYIERYRRGEIDAATLKVRRVPFGCYEQRTDGSYMVRVRTTGGPLPQDSGVQRRQELLLRLGRKGIVLAGGKGRWRVLCGALRPHRDGPEERPGVARAASFR